ncbi:hypothetical protein AVEN_252398-1 [Araneus ventricosus]|uniref:Uncharacterized protein n=1 Tax=Araneus ventricosus TaxID=182803 RepID=A0A4Y2ASG9_ARAVE|nr:hypothetical protein AVEN_252398-1 [Araneus ventricosus]
MARGLVKPRGSYLWTVVGGIPTSRGGAWLGKYLGSARVNGCTDAVWTLPPPLTCELFTAITREATDALTSPRTTSILLVPRCVITRTVDGTRGKTGRRNAALEYTSCDIVLC